MHLLLITREIRPGRSGPTNYQRRKIHENMNVHLNEVFFLNNSCWVPDPRHREEGKSSHELFEKKSCKRGVFSLYLGILGGLLGL